MIISADRTHLVSGVIMSRSHGTERDDELIAWLHLNEDLGSFGGGEEQAGGFSGGAGQRKPQSVATTANSCLLVKAKW